MKENDEEKKAKCLDDTSPEEMEEDISDKKMPGVKIMMRKKNLDAQMTLHLTIWRKM